jgi:hypothetical protein
MFFVASAMSVAAFAQSDEDEGLTPDQVELGEVVIKFANLDFPSIRVDGESWDDAEYTANGKQVSLHKVNRTAGHSIHLIPNAPGYDEADVVVDPADWKLVKVNKLDRAWKVEKQVSFKKKPVEQKKPEPAAVEEPGEVPPPEAGK